MKFNLRPSSFLGKSSSQSRHRGPQIVDVDPDVEVENHVSAGKGKDPLGWPSSNLAAPPPYMPSDYQAENAVGRPSPASTSVTQVFTAASGSGSGSSNPTHQTYASLNRLKDVAYLQAPMRKETKENALDTLRQYDTVIIMDDSASMSQDRRWEQACKALSELAQIAASYDKDGIDIHFLNHPKYAIGVKDSKSVRQLFKHVEPEGLTPIANKLDILVGDYVEKLEIASRKKHKGDPLALQEIKPVNFIIITDGEPTDEPLDSIVSLARRLDHGHYPLAQVGIQFVQIGDDKRATEFLRQLDDELSASYGVRDIVDTTPYLGVELTAEMLLKVLLGGINRRVDRRGGEAVMHM